MPTVDVLLYLTETSRQAPVWWMEELYRPYGAEYVWTDGAALVDLLDRAGIDVGLAHGSDIRRTTHHPRFPSQHEVHVPNDYTAAQCAAHPGRLYGVVCVDPLRDVREATEEIDRCVNEYGFRMMKLLPTYHHHDPADPRLEPVYEKCLELDLPIHTHTGFTPIINAPMPHARPVLLDELGIRYRDLKVVVYLAFPYVDEGIAVVARHPNFYADLSYYAGGDPRDLYRVLQKLRSLGALDRAVYGSDNNDKQKSGPGGVASDIFRSVNRVAEREGGSQITAGEMEAIMGGTAARLLKIPDRAGGGGSTAAD
ncbi:MAG: amidohydrolase family protein [bacterium]|nr:amidohydrolase family protein [bacterium]